MSTLWICDHYSTEPQYGGYARQYNFARALAARGHTVVVVASSFSHLSHRYLVDRQLHLSHVADGVTFAYVRTSPYRKPSGGKRLLNMLSYVRAVRKHARVIAASCGKPDTVLGCSVHPFAWVAAYRLSRRYHARFIAEVRDFWPEAWLLGGKHKRYDPEVILFAAVQKWAFSRAEKILYSMDHADRYLCGKLGLPRDRVVYLPQPADCERYDRLMTEGAGLLPQEVLDFCRDADVCLYAGQYDDRDGVTTMLEAAEKMQRTHPRTRFLFVGGGPDEENMRAFEKSHALSNTLIFGRIPKDSIPALLKSVRVCFLQLAQRGISCGYPYGSSKNKLTDYLYCGPCTVFAFEDADNPVTAAQAGFTIPPFDSDALYRALLQIADMDADTYAQFSQRGRAYILAHQEVSTLCVTLEKAAFGDNGKE